MNQSSTEFVPFGINATNEELILCLSRKVRGEALEIDKVTECDLYGDKEPWKIFNGTSEKILHFFTTLKRKNWGVSRFAGCGRWKYHKREDIYGSLGKRLLRLGFKTILRFKVDQGQPPFEGRYTMHEFSLAGDDQGKDYVLCRITFNERLKEMPGIEKQLDLVVLEENEAQEISNFEEQNQRKRKRKRKRICSEVPEEEKSDEQEVATNIDFDTLCSQILGYYGLRNQIEDLLPPNVNSELNAI